METGKALLTLALLGVCYLFVRLYHALVLNPKRLRDILRKQGINGPPSTFLLGNIREIRKAQSSTASHEPEETHNLAAYLFPFFDVWRNKFGQVFMFALGNMQILCVNEAEAVRDITTCKSLDLGKPTYQHKERGPLLGQGILTSNGTIWAHQRKIIAPELYMDKVKGMVGLITESTNTLVDSWKSRIAKEGGIAEMKIDEDVRSFSGDVISRACFGSNFAKEQAIFFKLRRLQEAMSKKSLAAGIPGARYLPTKNNKEAWALEKEVRNLILEVVRQRMESAAYERDLLQMVLEGAKNGDLSQEATERFIVDNCKNIYLAGYETTAVSAIWSLMLLAMHPDWQERIRKEVVKICGGRNPDSDMLRKMKQTLFEKMASSEVVNCCRKRKLNEGLLKNLEIVLMSADKVFDDAEEKQLRDPAVRKWLDELKEATYDAEDLIDSICTEILRRKIKREPATEKLRYLTKALFSPTFEKSIEPKMEKILARLKSILDQKHVFRFKEGVSIPQRLPATSLVEESGVYGRDAEKREIVELLLSDDASGDKISVIPIVGMGGIGKTTLAGLVFNDDGVSNHFEVKAWVNVSDEFDICRITKTILDHVVTSQASDIKDLNQFQVTLKKALRGKKFFFVLDDVWNRNYGLWDVLRSPFESGAHGSKIIVTTRDEGIALTMTNGVAHHLRTMSDEDCWHLFAKHAFNNVASYADPNLEIIGKKIVEKCKGLPLAVKSLAGLLRSRLNLEEWNKILESDIWELPNEDNILPALWLSYYYLPRHLKLFCLLLNISCRFQIQKRRIDIIMDGRRFLATPARKTTRRSWRGVR